MIQAILNLTNYLFGLNPGNLFNYSFWTALTAAACLLLAIAFIIVRRTNKNKIVKRMLRGFTSQFIFLAILLLLYVFFRINNVAVFSARIFLYLLVIWLIYLVYKIVKTVWFDIPFAIKLEMAKSEGETRYFLLKNKKRKGKKS